MCSCLLALDCVPDALCRSVGLQALSTLLYTAIVMGNLEDLKHMALLVASGPAGNGAESPQAAGGGAGGPVVVHDLCAWLQSPAETEQQLRTALTGAP